MKRIVRISDYCPETDSTQTVDVTFAEVRMVGSLSPSYKATSFKCSYASEHDCTLSTNCPLVRAAKSKMV